MHNQYAIKIVTIQRKKIKNLFDKIFGINQENFFSLTRRGIFFNSSPRCPLIAFDYIKSSRVLSIIFHALERILEGKIMDKKPVV